MVRLGVHTQDRVIAGSVNPGPPASRALMLGVTERGPINARGVIITTLAQYEKMYGRDTDYAQAMYYGAAQFFRAGGAQLVPVRVVGPAASNGSINLKDTAGLDTVRVETKDPGPHSGQYQVLTEVGAMEGTVTISVVDQDGTLLDSFHNVKTPQDLVSQAILADTVTVTDLGSATAAPGNLPALGAVTMTAGTDDRTGVDVESYRTALAEAGDVAPGGVIFAPGMPGDVYGQVLLDHAKLYNMQPFLSAGSGANRTSAVASARACSNLDHAEYGVFLYPELAVPDRLNSRAFWATPEATVAGRRAAVLAQHGYSRSPVGDVSRIEAFIKGTKDDVDRLAAESLADDRINSLVTTRGTQNRVNLLSYRTLSKDQASLGAAQHRALLNFIRVSAEYDLLEFLGRTIDGRSGLAGQISARIEARLQPLVDAGALYARTEDGSGNGDPGYAVGVQMGPANGTVSVSIQVRPSYDADLIDVEVIKIDPTTAL